MATKKAAKKAVKKAPVKAKAKTTKKLDGKALAANRKPRDSIAQFIKDELTGGATDVGKVLEKAKKEFPGKKPTRGYVRWVARHVLKKPLPDTEPKPKTKLAKAKAKTKAKVKAVEKSDQAATPQPASDTGGIDS